MKILVTGAEGFTGKHFVDSARINGHDIVELKADLMDRPNLVAELERANADAVVHLAAIAFVSHLDAREIYAVNVLGTTNLLDALLTVSKCPSSVLLVSSANVYGNSNASPIMENQPPAPVNHYAMSKLAMEYMARNYTNRLPILFTRPFNYTGLGQDESYLISKLVSHFSRRTKSINLGNLDVEREFNDVRMVCKAYLRLLETGIHGETYNVCTGVPVKLLDVVSLLQSLTGHVLDVNVNPHLIREQEIKSLFGSPNKLVDAIGDLETYTLEQTLTWMLKN